MKIGITLMSLITLTTPWCPPGAEAGKIQVPAGEIRLPSIISDNMVLQQKQKIPIWGWADPGEKVTVAIGDNQASAKAGPDSRWQVKLAPLPAQAEPCTMTVTGKKGFTLTVKNILVGEVWLGSGQSNMELGLLGTADGGEWAKKATLPTIRLLVVPHALSATPVDDVACKWVECSPETVKEFPATLYHFGRQLNEELKVPIGLISCVWGGSNIRSWIPPEGFASVPELRGYSEWINWANETRTKAEATNLDKFEALLAEMKQTAAESPDQPFWDKRTDKAFHQSILDAIPLFTTWLDSARKAAAENKPLPELPHPLITCHIYNPTLLYNGMVHPVVPFGLRGVLWYQGESDCGAGRLYGYQMKGLIQGWRKVWNQGKFPFYYAQVAPYVYTTLDPLCTPDDLPLLWEAQTSALALPNTGMVVTHDIGNVGDIHPKNKFDVGRRFVLWALAGTYGRKNLVCSGPLYDSFKVEGSKIRIRFKYAESGLITRDGQPPSWFTLAGKDGKFVPATAAIEGKTVVVSSPEVSAPAAVRLGWDQTADPNLANREGLPVSAFRTDL